MKKINNKIMRRIIKKVVKPFLGKRLSAYYGGHFIKYTFAE